MKRVGLVFVCALLLIAVCGCTAASNGQSSTSGHTVLNEQEQRVLDALRKMQSAQTHITHLRITGVDEAFDPSHLNIDIAVTYTDSRDGQVMTVVTRLVLDTGDCVDDPFGKYAELVENNGHVDIRNINAMIESDEALSSPT